MMASIKIAYTHLTYTTVEYLVFSYMFWQHFTIFRESIHQCLKLTKV